MLALDLKCQVIMFYTPTEWSHSQFSGSIVYFILYMNRTGVRHARSAQSRRLSRRRRDAGHILAASR
eukprot:1737052-Pleurochrysis_carterae.AAC.4